ncbi:MAG: hypothetical protein AAFX40_07905 [Cyanobacteria bacterium J06639_1]
MSSLKSFILPALLGFVAGIGHGVVSHHTDLPLSLGEQFFPALYARPLAE